MKISLGEAILLFGLLLLAWVVWSQQQELALLAEAVGGVETGLKPPPLPVQETPGAPPEGALPT